MFIHYKEQMIIILIKIIILYSGYNIIILMIIPNIKHLLGLSKLYFLQLQWANA